MINLTTANNALKTVYLDVLDNLLNYSTNPLFSKIKQSTKGVYGKEIKVLVPFGINGGITATSETGELPKASIQDYLTFTTTLKNLYGKIEISDKAMRASQNSAGAFVNLLNDEMEALIRSSSFNLGRMLYSHGLGILANITEISSDKKTVTVNKSSTMIEGMLVDVISVGGEYLSDGKAVKIVSVNRAENKITLETPLESFGNDDYILAVQNSFRNELTGLNSFVYDSIKEVYGLAKADCPYVKGSRYQEFGELTELKVLEKIDQLEETANVDINFIGVSSDVRRKYQQLLIESGRNVPVYEFGKGFKAIDFYGRPMVYDRFIENGTMYLVDTDTLTLHQMCDWEWMADESGNVLSHSSNYPVYSATLVKYCDMICDNPRGVGLINGIN